MGLADYQSLCRRVYSKAQTLTNIWELDTAVSSLVALEPAQRCMLTRSIGQAGMCCCVGLSDGEYMLELLRMRHASRRCVNRTALTCIQMAWQAIGSHVPIFIVPRITTRMILRDLTAFNRSSRPREMESVCSQTTRWCSGQVR